jgi:glycerol-3-phosphate dehydrogenase (NAD(P)+)
VQAEELSDAHENKRYLPGVELARDLRVQSFGADKENLARTDLVLLAGPSKGIAEALAELRRLGVSDRAGIVSLAKGLVPPDGATRTALLEAAFGAERVACVGGPAHAREMVESGAGLVCASRSEALAHRVAEAFQGAGVVCEVSDDTVGVELAGVAKNAAAVAVGATQAQGLNAAGMAAADIFLEVLSLSAASGGQARTFVGRAGTGDLVATALAPRCRVTSAQGSCSRRVCRPPRSLDASVRRLRRSRRCRCSRTRSSGRVWRRRSPPRSGGSSRGRSPWTTGSRS